MTDTTQQPTEKDTVAPARARKAPKKRGAKRVKAKSDGQKVKDRPKGVPSYPRHSLKKALRIPRAILEQNAGKACTDRDATKFAGLAFNGPSRVEVSSAIKYGLLSRPTEGKVEVTDLAKKILRPQKPTEEIDGLRSAFLNAPTVSEVYKHYRGENIPDEQFFRNALVDTFKIPEDKVEEFKAIFVEDLADADLVEDIGGKKRILDVAHESNKGELPEDTLKRISKGVKIEQGTPALS